MKLFKNLSITTKLGVITSIITFLSIMIGSSIFIKFETRMAKKMARQYANKLQSIIEVREESEKIALKKTMINNLDLFTSVAGDFLFDFRVKELKLLVNSLLNNNDILAVSIFDYGIKSNVAKPIIAGWKYPKRKVGKKLPENIQYRKLFKKLSKKYVFDDMEVGLIDIYYSENSIESSIKLLKNNSKKEIKAYFMSFHSQLNQLIIFQFCSVFIIIVIIILSQIYSIRKIVLYPLKSIETINYKLSEYDLTLIIEEKNDDELGKLFRAINTMVFKYKSIVNDVKNNGLMLSLTSKNIVNISKKLSTYSQATNVESENVSNASQKMLQHIQNILSRFNQTNENTKQISNSSEQIAQNVNMLVEALESMKKSIKTIQENAIMGSKVSKKAVVLADNGRKAIHVLEDASNEIGDVIQVIMKIADKTNLLALNAAIEAAAAGDAGKGFAVVANAIQEFADQIVIAAENITNRITSLQENAAKTIQVLIKITDIIKDMNNSISIINVNISEQSIMSDKISDNALEAQESVRQIASNMFNLAESTNDISNEISFIAQEADQVTTSMITVNNQTNESNNEINQLTDISNDLDNLSGELQERVNIFKT